MTNESKCTQYKLMRCDKAASLSSKRSSALSAGEETRQSFGAAEPAVVTEFATQQLNARNREEMEVRS
jgi:hypothetical protein